MDDVNKLKKKVADALLEKNNCFQELNKSTGIKYQLLRKKFNALNEKYWLLQERLDYYESTLIASDDEIEIKRFGNEIETVYSIYLKGEGIKIGQLEYNGYHFSIHTGDVGYAINYQYTGNNYAYKALCLLSDYLYRNGIPDYYISAHYNNIPSLRIIEKYGGIVLSKMENSVTFVCETRLLSQRKNLS